jgi:hypothetical protein
MTFPGRSTRQILAPFSKSDWIEIGHSRYSKLDFQPEFVQINRGVGFVYLRPEPLDSREVIGKADENFIRV